MVEHESVTQLPHSESVDILLLLEGTYPFVSGGVSSWVFEIISGFPDIRFGAVFVGSCPEDYGKMKYPLPENLVHLELHYLFDSPPGDLSSQSRSFSDSMVMLEKMHGHFHEGTYSTKADEDIRHILQHCCPGGKLNQDFFLHSNESWEYIKHRYREFAKEESFIDYIWTVRTIHAPIWRLTEIACSCVKAGAYHSISTGYAGFLGSILKMKSGRPLLLSEHGIYTKERRIDLYQSQWIKGNHEGLEKNSSDINFFSRMWIDFFEGIGRFAYHMSDHIVALYEENRKRQVRDGAPSDRTISIPNGINVDRFAALRAKRSETPPKVACLIGRVVPIKDIKTFIRAAHVVIARMPETELWIAGPDDEDPEYASQCRALSESLGLQGKLRFLGYQKLDELLPKIGLVVLSSISEALPLVILEGFAAGVPAVSTDVGSCKQLIYGLENEDRAMGAAGRVVGISDPQALAEAILILLQNTDVWQNASQAGIRRVERYYNQQLMFSRYRALYEESLSWQA